MPNLLSQILLLEPGGEIRIGDGAPGVNFTGMRIFKTMAGFGFETYVDDQLRQYLGSDGMWHQSATADEGPKDQVALDYKTLLEGNNTWKGVNEFLVGLILGDGAYLSSGAFASGLVGGEGFRLARTGSGKWGMELDSLRVRGQMSIAELLFQQVRTFNGSVIIGGTGTGKVTKIAKQK